MSGKGSKYWVSRHRYLELKHFCLQYPIFERNLLLLTSGIDIKSLDPTSERAITIHEYERVIALIKHTALECGGGVFEAVTVGKTAGVDKEKLDKFYYLLSIRKGL